LADILGAGPIVEVADRGAGRTAEKAADRSSAGEGSNLLEAVAPPPHSLAVDIAGSDIVLVAVAGQGIAGPGSGVHVQDGNQTFSEIWGAFFL
jgi:hypothetical protein